MEQKEVLELLTKAGLVDDPLDTLFVPTGSYALNRVISGSYFGGIPLRRITEIMGESSTGKTVFAIHALVEAQKLGYYTVFADNEFAFGADFAEGMGLDMGKLIYAYPDTVPECFAWLKKVILTIREHDKDTPIMMVLDSMAGQSDTEAVREDSSDINNMDGAVRAKEIGSVLRTFNPLLNRYNAGLIVINQVRNKVGVMYGDPNTRSGGGKALEFYLGCSIWIKSNKTSDVTRDENKRVIGIQGHINNKKNKVAKPFEECDFKLNFETGLDPYYGLADWLAKDGIISKNGGWYTILETDEKFQGQIGKELISKYPVIEEAMRRINT